MRVYKKYLKKRERAIIVILGKPRLVYTMGTFHKLRVEIKKLNAFFDLIKFCCKDFKREKSFRPFKLLFRQAGKVREVQVEEEMLEKYFAIDFLKEYRNNLRVLRLKRQKKVFSVSNEKMAENLKKKCQEAAEFLSLIESEQVNTYFVNRRYRIERLIGQKTLKASQIHLLRKRLKKYNFNERMLDLKRTTQTSERKDSLLKLLGKWHDCQVFIKHLELASKSEGINPAERNQLEEVKARISDDFDNLFNKINESIHEPHLFT
jgi:CHAD domain-containing protein